MTTLPTWLAVLVPLLTALMSGSAGIAGLLLGGRAAARAAERNAALARQDEQRRWNRVRREEAYVNLLERRNKLIEIRGHWRRDDTDRAEEDRLAKQSVGKALAVVELVGSTAAVELSRRWAEILDVAPRSGVRGKR
jgi:hypothetical protein